MTASSDISVVGRFPPPLDGQAIATARLADLLVAPEGGGWTVDRHDVGAPEGERLVTGGRLRLDRVAHSVRLPWALRQSLASRPDAPILWPSVSPSPLGHARDWLTVVPAFGQRPVVGVVHRGDFERLFQSPVTSATGRALVRRLHALVFLTPGLAERCAPFVPEAKRWIVANTIGAAAIPSRGQVRSARERRLARGGVRLLFLSGMIPSKGYPDVLAALAVLRGRGLDARASFVGRWPSEPARAAFERHIAHLGLAEHALVVGGIERAQVGETLLDADVFVLPTTYPVEAQPLTLIEALAAGTPVVTTRHAGVSEMIEDGRQGRFVSAHAPTEVADAVESLMPPDRWTAASVAARLRFEQAYSPAAVGARWQEVLARL